jgi:hypothetical protein
MPKKPTHHEEHEVHHDAAADDDAANPAAPTTYAFSAKQVAVLKTLGFHSEQQLAHTRKVAPDVGGAFSAQVIAAITANPLLGGPARAQTITALLAQQAQLLDLASVANPIARLIAQNLLVVNAQLAQNISEPLKVANALAQTQPNLLEELATLVEWNQSHHGTARVAKKPAQDPKDAPTKK